jgi:hypothetical protein
VALLVPVTGRTLWLFVVVVFELVGGRNIGMVVVEVLFVVSAPPLCGEKKMNTNIRAATVPATMNNT